MSRVFWKSRKEWWALTGAPERSRNMRTERWAHSWRTSVSLCFSMLYIFLLFRGSLSGEGWLCPWWGHFCLSGAGGPSLTESWREHLLYWKGKWKIPGHFQVYLILPTGPGSGRFVGLLIDKENEVQRENIANFRSWALKKNFLNEIKLIYLESRRDLRHNL